MDVVVYIQDDDSFPYEHARTCDGNEMNYGLTKSGHLLNRDFAAAYNTIF